MKKDAEVVLRRRMNFMFVIPTVTNSNVTEVIIAGISLVVIESVNIQLTECNACSVIPTVTNSNITEVVTVGN